MVPIGPNHIPGPNLSVQLLISRNMFDLYSDLAAPKNPPSNAQSATAPNKQANDTRSGKPHGRFVWLGPQNFYGDVRKWSKIHMSTCSMPNKSTFLRRFKVQLLNIELHFFFQAGHSLPISPHQHKLGTRHHYSRSWRRTFSLKRREHSRCLKLPPAPCQ